MSSIAPATGDQLASALDMLGVKFLLSGTNRDDSLHRQPGRLIAELAGSKEARLRLSLIPLFLEHPEFASRVREIAQSLGGSSRLTLQCHYTAAVFLQQQHYSSVTAVPAGKSMLPDFFSRELDVHTTPDSQENLRRLAQRHQTLSNVQVNWLGTYQHAAQIWIRGVELQNS